MALWRRTLFVVYAIVSYIYRWVVTYFILWFLYNFLRPYKLGVISGMLALAALASMIGWPLYNLVRNVHRRGRLPDMKRIRVAITLSIFAALVVAFCTVPLPVSRVTTEGVVEVHPDEIESVYAPVAHQDEERGVEKVILEELYVHDGQLVEEKTELARFSNPDLQKKLLQATREVKDKQDRLATLDSEFLTARADKDIEEFKREIGNTRTALAKAEKEAEALKRREAQEERLLAPRAGIVMGLPRIEQVRKQWDNRQPLFCRIGDPDQLRVLIPVVPAQYSLLQENLGSEQRRLQLQASVRVHGMGRATWRGRVTRLPEAEAARIPLALSNKANGPVAVKPSNNPEELVPQTQQYLVSVDLLEHQSLRPGQRAKVKIHCKKRTLAWWLWRTVNDTFNLGLI